MIPGASWGQVELPWGSWGQEPGSLDKPVRSPGWEMAMPALAEAQDLAFPRFYRNGGWALNPHLLTHFLRLAWSHEGQGRGSPCRAHLVQN